MQKNMASSSEDDDPMEEYYNKLHKNKKTSNRQVIDTDNKKQEIFPIYNDSDSDDIENYKTVQRHLMLTSGGAKLAEDEIISDGTTSENDIDDWGSKKRQYYGSEEVEKLKKKRMKVAVEDAELEEADAMRIQNEIYQNFQEDEFDQFFRPTPNRGPLQLQSESMDDEGDTGFLEEFERLGSLLTDVLDPLLTPNYDLVNSDTPAYEFVSQLHRLYNGYRSSFLFYQYLKSKGNLTSDHPVLQRLREYYVAVRERESVRLANWEAAEYFLSTSRPLVREVPPKMAKKVRFDEKVDDEEEVSEEPVKRQITSQMLKNVGMLASRSRKAKTPRTRNRQRYEKGAKKHRSQVAQMRDQAVKYTGEPSGIRGGVIKSTRFR